MNKFFIFSIFFTGLQAMEHNDQGLPRTAVERCALIGALARGTMERLPHGGRNFWIPGHPKAFIHFIVMDEIVDEAIVDHWITDDYHLTECVLAQPVFEQAAQSAGIVCPHLNDEQCIELGRQVLAEYREKIARGYASLETLVLVQDYVDAHQQGVASAANTQSLANE